MEIVKSKYTGYCQGVKKALNIVEKTRNENEKSKIYLYGSLIHNEQIYHKLKSLNITQIPFGAKISLLNSDDIIIFSAHGHPIHVENDLKCKIIDTTCSIVSNNLNFINKNKEKQILYIGEPDHEETVTALSFPNVSLFNSKINNDSLIINQTSFDYLKYNKITQKINKNQIFENICPNIKNRINEILNLPKNINKIFIIGSHTSSNANSLFKVALSKLSSSYLISCIDEIPHIDKSDNIFIGCSCSASIEQYNSIVEFITTNNCICK